MYSIGFGYTAGSYTEPPVEIAALTTSDSGGTTADIIFGTRNVTTNTAVTERMRLDSNGQIMIQGSATAFDTTAAKNGLQAYYETDTGIATLGSYSAGGSTLMTFHTSSGGSASSEAMRLDNFGNLLVGTTAQQDSNNTGNNFTFSTSSGYAWIGVSDAGGVYIQRQNDGNVLSFYRATVSVGSISVDSSAPTTNYNTTSDQRLKENIVDAPAGNIDDIRVRSFDWKESGVHQNYGMVAQELVDVSPEAVSQGETEDDIWQVDYSKLVPMMIKEIQDLKAEVAALKGE